MPWKPSWCIVVARKTIGGQEDEVADLYDLQDDLEQYTRKNSLEIHGVPESAYTSTEEVVPSPKLRLFQVNRQPCVKNTE